MKTFELEDINNELFEKTILIYMNHNSGYIEFITRDKEYILSFLNIPFNEYALENIHPFLKRNMNYYAFEKLGFKKLKSYVYVKEDVYFKVKDYCQNKTIFLYREVIEQILRTKIEKVQYIEEVKYQQKLVRQEDIKKVNQLSLQKEEQNERVRYYKPIVLFGGNAYKIIELTKNIPYKDAVYNLMEYFKIDEDLAERILELTVKDLRCLNKAKEML